MIKKMFSFFKKTIIIFVSLIGVIEGACLLNYISDKWFFKNHEILFDFILTGLIILSIFVIALCGEEKKSLSKFFDLCWNIWTCVVTIVLINDVASNPILPQNSSISSSMIILYREIQSHPEIGALFLMLLLLITAARVGFALGSLFRRTS